MDILACQWEGGHGDQVEVLRSRVFGSPDRPRLFLSWHWRIFWPGRDLVAGSDQFNVESLGQLTVGSGTSAPATDQGARTFPTVDVRGSEYVAGQNGSCGGTRSRFCEKTATRVFREYFFMSKEERKSFAKARDLERDGKLCSRQIQIFRLSLQLFRNLRNST